MTGLAAAAALLALYAASLAPGVTLWDAGEFIAAIHTLGVPHPPGTPLYVALGHAWVRALGAAGVDIARAANFLSATCTAAACGVLGSLAARWSGRAPVGLAAALCAGTAASVWLNATETEVYAASLLLSAVMLWCGDRRAREGDAPGARRWTLLLAYAISLAPALHLSALVAAPAAIVRATWSDHEGVRRGEAVALAGVMLLAVGVGTGAWPALAGGAALLIGVAVGMATLDAPERRALAAAATLLALLGVSALAIMLVRSRLDPAINQGNPSTLGALLDVIWRRQYEPVPLWPRRAPLWLQLGNVIEYADWQWALGLHGGVAPSLYRTPITLAYLALAAVGCVAHRRVHRPSWRAAALLVASASLGVALYLNLKTGPSYGGGFIPESAPHEARERDYFFALAFWGWGAWAGAGAVALAGRVRLPAAAGVLVAALPALLNWRAADRSAEPEASLARAAARSLLGSAPRRTVLFVNGDNDTYPLWYLQQVEGERRDVTVVTVPLLGAPWYRAELARRWGLVDAEAVSAWRGEPATVARIARLARAAGRPVAVSVATPVSVRREVGQGPWSPRGMLYVERSAEAPAGWLAEDSLTTAELAASLAPLVSAEVRDAPDAAPRGMLELLGCPAATLRAARPKEGAARGGEAVPDQLDSVCNLR